MKVKYIIICESLLGSGFECVDGVFIFLFEEVGSTSCKFHSAVKLHFIYLFQ
jgi:hypothetical protein